MRGEPAPLVVWSREDGQPLELRAVTDREQNLHIYSALARHRRITNQSFALCFVALYIKKNASTVFYETGSSGWIRHRIRNGPKVCQIFTKNLLEIESKTTLEKYDISSCIIKSNQGESNRLKTKDLDLSSHKTPTQIRHPAYSRTAKSCFNQLQT